MINYAHRGASEYAPENTLSAFYLGLLQGANGIETDVQKTKDGELVLFHDSMLNDKSDGFGTVGEHTWAELQRLQVYGKCTTGFYDRIVSLRAFLEKFSGYDTRFAIELKGADVEAETLAMVKDFGVMEKTTFTSFRFEYIQKVKQLDKSARVGWLTSATDDDAIARLLAIGGEEFCPKAELMTPEFVEKCRQAGLGIRARGVTNVLLMKKMCQLGVDGMTVDFPDRLYQYLNASRSINEC